MSFFQKIKTKLASAGKALSSAFSEKLNYFFNSDHFSQENIDELEEVLLESDVGANTTEEILKIVKSYKYLKKEDQKLSLKNQIYEFLLKKVTKLKSEINLVQGLNILIMCGVNGSGKTTTIRKMCHLFNLNKKLVACCDTFRAAAYEQLQIGIKDTNAYYFEYSGKNTPDSVAYQAIKKAIDQEFDILFLDTSGRLQNNKNLMEEFTKFSKVAKKINPDLNPKVILVLDGSSGQNIINQIEVFSVSAKLDGLILTKFDGLAKGGIILQIADKFNIPIYFLGVGEGPNDLEVFEPEEFVKKLIDF